MFSYELHRQLHLSSGVSVMYVPSILVACIFFLSHIFFVEQIQIIADGSDFFFI